MESNSSKLVSDDPRESGDGRLERARLFVIAVRNELKRVNWPSGREVSVWLFRRFGVS